MSLVFVLGGARSGKTRYALSEAQRLATEAGGRKVMIATSARRGSKMMAL